MSGTRLYVGNLPPDVTREEVERLFDSFGGWCSRRVARSSAQCWCILGFMGKSAGALLLVDEDEHEEACR